MNTALARKSHDAQLAERMRVSRPRISAFEKAEISGGITLASLERAAEALDCTFVYALVPRRSLNEMVETRALEKATAIVSYINRTMLLEAQNVDATTLKKKRDDLAADMLHGLWSDE